MGNNLLGRTGLGIILFSGGVFLASLGGYWVGNSPKDYNKYVNIKENIYTFEKTKKSFQKVNYDLCSKDLEKKLDELYFKKSEFENTVEFKEYEESRSKNAKYFFGGFFGGLLGICICLGSTIED